MPTTTAPREAPSDRTSLGASQGVDTRRPDCPETDLEWGQTCPRCHQPTPPRPTGPPKSWHSERNIEAALSEASTRIAPLSPFQHRDASHQRKHKGAA